MTSRGSCGEPQLRGVVWRLGLTEESGKTGVGKSANCLSCTSQSILSFCVINFKQLQYIYLYV
jgi:hypothetical protein